MAEKAKDQQAVLEKQSDQRLSTADLAGASKPSAPVENQAPVKTGTDGTSPAPLFPANDVDKFRARWEKIQIGFVDQPSNSVEQADTLVAEVMKELAQTFANERANMEKQWNSGNDVSTEDLRQALRRYRSFFDRLLSV